MNLIALRQRFRHPDTPLYQFHQGAVLTPGTQNLVFEPAFELPTFAVAQGVKYTPFFAPLQPPQIWQSKAVGVNGLGGIVAGQMALQSLQLPDNDNTIAV